jgi:hypothetical protein
MDMCVGVRSAALFKGASDEICNTSTVPSDQAALFAPRLAPLRAGCGRSRLLRDHATHAARAWRGH